MGTKFKQMESIKVATTSRMLWDPLAPSQGGLWPASVTLTDEFYRQVIDRPVPIDLRAMRALRKSPLALDLYAWSTYRTRCAKKPVVVPWEALRAQFGVGYPGTRKGINNFKGKLLAAMQKVCLVYPELRVEDQAAGLLIKPSPSHVLSLPPKRKILPIFRS